MDPKVEEAMEKKYGKRVDLSATAFYKNKKEEKKKDGVELLKKATQK